jgi:hypothetical protein
MLLQITDRAQELIDQFEDGEDVRHGIANVLDYLANYHDSYSSGDEYWHGVTVDLLQDLAEELTAPTVLERALGGDRCAAKQFLQAMGVIGADGQLISPYRPEDLND